MGLEHKISFNANRVYIIIERPADIGLYEPRRSKELRKLSRKLEEEVKGLKLNNLEKTRIQVEYVFDIPANVKLPKHAEDALLAKVEKIVTHFFEQQQAVLAKAS